MTQTEWGYQRSICNILEHVHKILPRFYSTEYSYSNNIESSKERNERMF